MVTKQPTNVQFDFSAISFTPSGGLRLTVWVPTAYGSTQVEISASLEQLATLAKAAIRNRTRRASSGAMVAKAPK